MSFLDDYCIYATEFSDAPESTHYRIALSLMSICLNRKVWINQGDNQLHPNLWTMVVAPSGWNRKTSTMRTAKKILTHINPDYILANDFSSRERFIECLAKQPQSIIFISEFKSFMGMLSRDYMAGMQSVLTELFDGDDYKKSTKIQGDINITAPFFNFIACTTVEWMVNSIGNDDIAGGFLPRFLIFRAPKRDKNIAFQPLADLKKKEGLVNQLFKINKIKGELKFSPEAIKYYERWYNEFVANAENLPGLLIPFSVRLADYAKKFAILYCVDRCAPTLEIKWDDGDYDIQSQQITKDDVHMACLLAENYADELVEFMDTEISFSYKEKIKKRVSKMIREKHPHPIDRTSLLRGSGLTTKDLTAVLETLEDEKRIVITEEQAPGQGRQRTYLKQSILWQKEDKTTVQRNGHGSE